MAYKYDSKIGIVDGSIVKPQANVATVDNDPIVGITILFNQAKAKFTIIDPRGFHRVSTPSSMGVILPYMLQHAIMDTGKIISPCVWLRNAKTGKYLPFPTDSAVCMAAIQANAMQASPSNVNTLSPGDRVVYLKTNETMTYLGPYTVAYYRGSRVTNDKTYHKRYDMATVVVYACVSDTGQTIISKTGFKDELFRTNKTINVSLHNQDTLSRVSWLALARFGHTNARRIVGGVTPGIRTIRAINRTENTDLLNAIPNDEYGYCVFANSQSGDLYVSSWSYSMYWEVHTASADLTMFRGHETVLGYVRDVSHYTVPTVEWS